MFKKKKTNTYNELYSENTKRQRYKNSSEPNNQNAQMLPWIKQIALFAMGLGGFELIGLVISTILISTGINNSDQVLANMLLNTLVYAVLFVCLLAITNKDIKKLLTSFNSWKPYAAGVLCFFAIIVCGMIYSTILSSLGIRISNNDNQQAIDSTTNRFPLTAIVIFGIIGPICEELTYRVGLFSFSKRISKWVAYPITIAVFALIHFNFSASSITNELLNLPYYAIAGLALSFTYDKYGFAGSVTAHILNNVISLVPLARFLKLF